MRKYFNKGLIYQWFNSAKAGLALGMVIWGVIANSMIQESMQDVRMNISNSFANSYRTTYLEKYVFLGFIFIMIYFISQGINKRNSAMFLLSSPYTKKEIKYNELICLLITLAGFIVEYIYIAFMKYIQHKELIAIIDGYFPVMGIEIIRILLLGIIGILIMLIVDFMFSNSLAGLISMISLLPFSIVIIAAKIGTTLGYINVGNGKTIFDLINKRVDGVATRYYRSIFLDIHHMNEIRLKYLAIEVIISLLIIGVLMVLYNSMQKKYKIELSNTLFTSQKNEKIFTGIVCLGIGSFASLMFLDGYISRLGNTGEYYSYVLSGMTLIKALALDIGCVLIVAFICSKIIKKILKTVE